MKVSKIWACSQVYLNAMSDYNPGKNYWERLKKSSKNGKDKKSLISVSL